MEFSANDARERGFSDKYMEAYEETIRETATEDSPLYVVPADHNWFTRVIVAAAVIDALASLKLHYPQVSVRRKTNWRWRERYCSRASSQRARDHGDAPARAERWRGIIPQRS